MADNRTYVKCDASTIFYPGDEDIDVYCELPAGHEGPHTEDGWEWTDNDD